MLVLGVNKILEWCQIFFNGRKYTCRTKEMDGKLFFYFKREWHSVSKFVSDNAEELVREGGRVISRKFRE